MDARSKIQLILDECLLPCGILSHHTRRPDVNKIQGGGKINNDVYVVYRVVTTNNSVYGGGQPTLKRTTFDINYYYRYTDNNSDSIASAACVHKIENSFKQYGWRVINGQSDLFDTDIGFRGINIEVSYSEVANGKN